MLFWCLPTAPALNKEAAGPLISKPWNSNSWREKGTLSNTCFWYTFSLDGLWNNTMPNQHIIPKCFLHMYMFALLTICNTKINHDRVSPFGHGWQSRGPSGMIPRCPWETFTRDTILSFTGQMFDHHPIGVELVAAQGSLPSPLSERTNEVSGDVLLLGFRWPAWAGPISPPQRSNGTTNQVRVLVEPYKIKCDDGIKVILCSLKTT